jgi:uncharacterized membrane protein YdbT with pleckstrin-like domain
VIYAVIKAKNYRVDIDDTTIRLNHGVFKKGCEEYAIAGITYINICQSLWGRIWNYGNVQMCIAGGKQIYLYGIRSPKAIKSALQAKLQKSANAQHVFTN